MKRILVFIFATLFLVQIKAQTLNASIDDVGGYYRLTFTINSQASDFNPPSFADLEILSGPNLSSFSNIQITNRQAVRSSTTSYTYIVSAKKSGKLTIGSASVKVGNRIIRSKPITFNAQAGSSSNANGNSANQSHANGNSIDNSVQQTGTPVTNRDLFIDATTSHTKVNEQEAILLTYNIHYRAGVGLANTQLSVIPDFKGFISQEIPLAGNQIQTNLEQRNGTTYRTGTILQYLLFPQQSGKLTIPSITFDCTVVQQNNHLSLADAFFNGGGSIGVKVQRRVPEKTIQVKPLPQPRPANFSGAVGKFSISGKLLNPSIKTNDIATYRITINGSGNLKLITPPSIAFPSDFDSYDAKTNEHTKATTDGLTGRITFDYNFVARNTGKYEIPAVKFTYFDLESQSYKTIQTEGIHLNVTQGERSNADIDRQLALLHSDIKDIHATDKQHFLSAIYKWGTLSFWLINAILVISFAMLMTFFSKYMKKQSNHLEIRRTKAGKTALQKLELAEQTIKANDSKFYTLVSQALTNFIFDSFNIEQADLNASTIQSLLLENGFAADVAENFVKLIQTCEFAQYAPSAETQRIELLSDARQSINTIQQGIKK